MVLRSVITGLTTTLLVVVGLFVGSLGAAQEPAAPLVVTWSGPNSYVQGHGFVVTLRFEVADAATRLEGWRLTPASFSVAGEPLGERPAGEVLLAADSVLELTVDLGPSLAGFEAGIELELGCVGTAARKVPVFAPAGEGLAFYGEQAIPEERLGDFMVLMETGHGPLLFELHPGDAPGHVRNFLDLSYTGFYDGLTVHRVVPGFMLQGGDPTGTGKGLGPRNLVDEFSARPHRRGVLSMARTPEPDSASCQFFVMLATAQHLDGKYSSFGVLVDGFDVLDSLAAVETGALDRPVEEQLIERMTVLTRGAKAPNH